MKSAIGSGFPGHANGSARITDKPESKKPKKKIIFLCEARALNARFSFQDLVKLMVSDHSYFHFRAFLDVSVGRAHNIVRQAFQVVELFDVLAAVVLVFVGVDGDDAVVLPSVEPRRDYFYFTVGAHDHPDVPWLSPLLDVLLYYPYFLNFSPLTLPLSSRVFKPIALMGMNVSMTLTG